MLNGRYGRVQESLIVLTAEGTGGGKLVGSKVETIDVFIIVDCVRIRCIKMYTLSVSYTHLTLPTILRV